MRFVVGAVSGLVGWIIFRQIFRDVLREDVRMGALGTHLAAGVGGVVFMMLFKGK